MQQSKLTKKLESASHVALAMSVTLGLLFLVRTYAITTFEIVSESMLPTLRVGDRVLVTSGRVNVGDVVAIRLADGRTVIKRIVAAGGDRIAIEDDAVVVNQTSYSVACRDTDCEERIGDRVHALLRRMPTHEWMDPVTVPANHLFVMGDNRTDSTDSRQWPDQFVPVSMVLGRVAAVLYSSAAFEWSRVGSSVD